MKFYYKKLSLFILLLLPFISNAMDSKDVIARIRGTADKTPLKWRTHTTEFTKNADLKNLQIKELKKRCLAEDILNVTKKIAKSDHTYQVAACLPFWYTGCRRLRNLYHSNHYLETIEKYGCKKTEHPIVTELLKSIGKCGEISTYSGDNDNLNNEMMGSPAGAVADKFIILTGSLKTYPNEAKKYAIGHEINHIINSDSIKRATANIFAPILSYGIIQSGKFVTNKIIDMTLAQAKKEDIDTKLCYRALIETKSFINDISKNAFLQYVLSLYLLSKFTQYQETQADIGAILLTRSFEGALSFFEHYTARPHPPINFLDMFRKHPLEVINILLGYTEHPSNGTRVKTMIEFARKNGLPEAENYLMLGNNRFYNVCTRKIYNMN
jgi:hypothetical protein